jgi:hypothetical protein
MARITQYSRISHHTIAGSASAGLTFSVPAQEDFTDGSWTPYDLALSEIGVNEQDERVFMRIDDEIKEFAFIGASGVGFTGGPGNCITDLYLTNMYGCSPITIHDDFIQKDGTSVNSEDSNLQITFDAGGVGTFDVQKINGTTTQLERLTVGDYGIQIQTTATNSNVSGFILCEDTNQSGTDINIQLESISAPDSSRIQLGPSSSLWRTSDGTLYDNRITINTTDMIFKAEDLLAVTYGELQLTHAVSFFSHYNNGLLSYIQAQDNTIDIQTQGSGSLNRVALDSSTESIEISSVASGGEFSSIDIVSTATPSIVLRTEDNSFTEVSSITMTKDGIGLFSTDNTLSISAGCSLEVIPDEIKLSAGYKKLIVTKTEIQYKTSLNGVEPTNYNIESTSTTNATPLSMYGINFGITNSVITIEAVVNGWGATNSKAYGAKLFGTFKNAGGTVTQLSTTDKSEKTDFSTATSDFNISGTNVQIRVTGEALTDINWASRFNYQISK